MTNSGTLFPSKPGAGDGGVWDEDDATDKREEGSCGPRRCSSEAGRRVAPWTDTDSPRSSREEP